MMLLIMQIAEIGSIPKQQLQNSFINDLKKFFYFIFWMCHDEYYSAQWKICALKFFFFYKKSWHLLWKKFILKKSNFELFSLKLKLQQKSQKFCTRMTQITHKVMYKNSLFTLQQTLTLWISITSDLSCKKSDVVNHRSTT